MQPYTAHHNNVYQIHYVLLLEVIAVIEKAKKRKNIAS